MPDSTQPNQNRFRPTWVTLGLLAGILFLSGCQSIHHPWEGKPYQRPSETNESGRTLFSPTPRLLPPQIMQPIDTESSDRQIEQQIFGLNALDSADSNGDEF